MSNCSREYESVPVTEIEHYTENLFRFRVIRPQNFRFRAGEFTMIGLSTTPRQEPIFRAYSIASSIWDDMLEFYSIKVVDGQLTSQLKNILVGDSLLIKKKTTGTLTNDALLPGSTLWLLATGTGIAPYASIIRDQETYEKFSRIILVHCTRLQSELQYSKQIFLSAQHCLLVGKQAKQQLHYYGTTTRDQTKHCGRITTLIETETLFHDLAQPTFNPTCDRVMICGSIMMLKDLRLLVEKAGLREGTNNCPAEFVIERAFIS